MILSNQKMKRNWNTITKLPLRILTLCVILLASCLTCKAQVRTGDAVTMSLAKYRQMRITILAADTLEKECDSLQVITAARQIIKDSIIQIQKNKLAIKDSIIAEKSSTIKEVAAVAGKQPKYVGPLIIVAVCEFFLLVLAIK